MEESKASRSALLLSGCSWLFCWLKVATAHDGRKGVFMKTTNMFIIGLATLLCWTGSLNADYTIVLKNGGRITVKDYREEKGMVMLEGLGGELGIAKQQIRSILQAGEGESQGLGLATIEKSQRTADKKVLTTEVEVRPNIRRFEVNDQKEKEDQEMLDVNTEAIESRTELYRLITRGKPGVEPTLLDNLVALEGRINLLNSRLKDAKYKWAARRSRRTRSGRSVQQGGTLKLTVNSQFAGRRRTIVLTDEGIIRPGRVTVRPFHKRIEVGLLPGYSRGEREISELKKQLLLLCKARKRLTQSMKQEGIFTSSLPYDYQTCPN